MSDECEHRVVTLVFNSQDKFLGWSCDACKKELMLPNVIWKEKK